MIPLTDEGRHEPEPERLWNESWYFDFTSDGGGLGGWIRLGLYPNMGVAWYHAFLVGTNRRLIAVADHSVRLPRGPGLDVRAEGLWADHVCETPLEHWSVANECHAVALDDPAEMYGRMLGDRVPLAFDLEWETDGEPYPYPGVTRYEIPCRVHGEVLVGDERLAVDGPGQRDHSWGVRDWWVFGWVWTSGHFDDGTHFHGADIRIRPDLRFGFGYVQAPGEELAPLQAVDATEELGDAGLPLSARIGLGGLDLDVTPIAFAPVLLTAEDGRLSRFPRALCRFTDRATGRSGPGWTEWNQPQI